MHDSTLIIIVALVLLALVEIIALSLGIDGAILSTVIGIFGAAAGYTVKSRRQS